MDLTLGGIESEINVATATKRIRFTGQFVVVQRNAVLVPWIELTAGEHQFKLFHQYRKYRPDDVNPRR